MRTMRLSFSVLAAAVLATACGEGRAIFNVDVYSFIQGTGGDTLSYVIPSGLQDSVRDAARGVTMLKGIGNAVVDTVVLSGNALIENQTGTGTITFKVFFGLDSSTVYQTTPLLSSSGAAGPGSVTDTLRFLATLTSAQDSIFTQGKAFVGIQIGVSNTSGTTLQGRFQLHALDLHIVTKEKIF